jgi:hypothetical protein
MESGSDVEEADV